MPVSAVGLVVGPHLPSAEVYREPLARCRAAGARIFQFRTRSEKRGEVSPGQPPTETLRELRECWQGLGLLPPAAHAPRGLDLSNPDRAPRREAVEALGIDCAIARAVGATTVVVHPGRGPCADPAGAAAALIDSLGRALSLHPDLRFLVELRFGVGGEFGARLEDLARVFDGVGEPRRLGLCLDVAHAYWAGELVPEHADRLADRIEALFGPDAIRLAHLNDAQFAPGWRRYRHRPPGWGHMSVFGFFDLFASRLLEGVPLITEGVSSPGSWPDVTREVLRMVERAEAAR